MASIYITNLFWSTGINSIQPKACVDSYNYPINNAVCLQAVSLQSTNLVLLDLKWK